MNMDWTESRVLEYINAQIPESLTLDYKAAAALARDEGKRREITKDISALANAAGGIIIYGVSENHKMGRPCLPYAIDPIDPTKITCEWLENTIHNIHPRIDGVLIHTIPVGSSLNSVVYVIEVPQGTTAHQAADCRYYKRYNFQSAPMDDHEVRDIMNRGHCPQIEMRFRVIARKILGLKIVTLKMDAHNCGAAYAEYAKCRIFLPPAIARHRFNALRDNMESIDGIDYFVVDRNNRKREVFRGDDRQDRFGTAWFDPILPGQKCSWPWNLPSSLDYSALQSDEEIRWEAAADHAILRRGSTKLRDIEYAFEQISVRSLLSTFLTENPSILFPLLGLGALGLAVLLILGYLPHLTGR